MSAPERVRRHAEYEEQELHFALLLHRELRGDGARQRHERQHRDAREDAHEQHEWDYFRGEASAARAEQRRVREVRAAEQLHSDGRKKICIRTFQSESGEQRTLSLEKKLRRRTLMSASSSACCTWTKRFVW